MTEILDAKQLADRLQIHADQVRKMTADGRIPHLSISPRITRYNLDDVCAALRVAQHPDDDAVDTFAQVLRKRMAEKREEGREGWEHSDLDELGLKLLRSLADGNPVDVGNYAMMIANLGGGTEHVIEKHVDTVLFEVRSAFRLIPCQAVEQWNRIAEEARRLMHAYQDEDGDIKPAMNALIKELNR